jgi:phytoene dehydrogenase-like protein
LRAGMAAGNVLSEHGVKNVLFLEATSEIGGRLRTQAFGGYNLQVGSDWMEGLNGPEETNPLFSIAQEVSLVMTSPVTPINITNNIYDKT